MGGEFHLTTAQLGPNLYIGNHAGASGTYDPLVEGHGSARDERDDATRLAEQAVGRQLSPREVSGYWTTQAVTYMRAHPADWVRLTAHKARLAFNAHEISDTESQDVYADSSIVLRALAPLSFGVLLVCRGRCGPHRTPVEGSLAALRDGHDLRRRADRVLRRRALPLSAGAAVAVVRRWRGRRRHERMASAAGHPPGGGRCGGDGRALYAFVPSENVRAARWTHFTAVASTLSRSGENDEAIALYQRALTELPAAPAAEFGLATALVRSGRSDDALPHFAATVRAWPEHAEARYNFGLTLLKVGHLDEAIGQLLESTRLRPDDLDARMAAGRALMAASRPDEAVAHYRAVLTRFPRHVAALAALGVALSASGHLDDALGVYRTAFEIDPTNPNVQNNWGWSLASSGQIEDAIPHFERALALDPAHANARENLKRAQAALK